MISRKVLEMIAANPERTRELLDRLGLIPKCMRDFEAAVAEVARVAAEPIDWAALKRKAEEVKNGKE